MHGVLTLSVYREPKWLWPGKIKPTPLFQDSVGPGYSEEESKVLDYLSFWYNRSRGVFTELAWSPEVTKQRKVFSPEKKFRIACKRHKTMLLKKCPMFADQIFEETVLPKLQKRYGVNND